MFTTLMTAQSMMKTKKRRLPAGLVLLLFFRSARVVSWEVELAEIILPPLEEGGDERVDGRMVFFAIVSTLGRTIIFHHDVIVKMSKSPPNPKSFDFWREKRDEKKGNSFLR
jgi:hypothetical protein